MALYHLTAKPLSRSTRNTVGAVAYRAGCKLQDIRTGESFNYARKAVQHVDLVLAKEAPKWILQIQHFIKENRELGVQTLVDRVEAAETRINSRVWREIEFALHRELSHDQNMVLAKEFVEDQLCSRGMVALLNFHFDKDPKTSEGKPHCHVLLTTREVNESGFGKKVRDWNKRELLTDLREQWAAYSNFHLKLHGHEIQIDHRSYYDRGIDLEPQPKYGKSVREIEEKAHSTSETPKDMFVTEKAQAFHDVQLRNLYRILRRPELVFEIVSKHHSTFMWADVQTVLLRYVEDEGLFQKMESRLRTSQELILLSPESTRMGAQGGETAIYTTRSLLKTEKALLERAEALDKVPSHGVEKMAVKEAIRRESERLKSQGGRWLSRDQITAIHHFTTSGQLKCGVGMAGAGKTTALGVAQEIWKLSDYNVYGLAPTGKAAQNLQQSGIASTTLHKFLKSFEEGRYQYNPKTVLVLDEAGMVDVGRFSKLLEAAQNLRVKLIVVGDGAQLQSVEAGPAFRLITERIGKTELNTVLRQKKSWQREATILFGKQQTREALRAYHDHGHIHIVEEKIPSLTVALANKDTEALQQLHSMATYIASRMYREMTRDVERQASYGEVSHIRSHPDHLPYLKWKAIELATAQYVQSSQHQETDVRKQAKEELLKKWHRDFKSNPGKSSLILTFTNKDVGDLNSGARFLLKQSGHIEKEEILFKTAKEHQDDFGKKHTVFKTKGFSKGDRIVFTTNNYGLSVKNGTLGTITDLTKSLMTVKIEGEARVLSFAPHLNPFFDHGWAITIHKAQGTTTDRTYVLASYDMTRNLTYVAMTRHREDVQVFGSSIDFWRPEKLSEILATLGEKLAARDYLDAKSLEKLMKEEDKLVRKVFTHLSDELQAMGVVSKQAFRQVTDQFLGRTQEPALKPRPECLKSLREEERAEKLFTKPLPKAPKAQKEFWREPSSSFPRPDRKSFPLKKDPNPGDFETKAIQEIARYIEDKLHTIKTYAGTKLAHKARDDLSAYTKSLGENKDILDALRNSSPQLIREIYPALKEQDHSLRLEHGTGRELGL